jgi:hypothetical protein
MREIDRNNNSSVVQRCGPDTLNSVTITTDGSGAGASERRNNFGFLRLLCAIIFLAWCLFILFGSDDGPPKPSMSCEQWKRQVELVCHGVKQ